jgi:hypothetical protein
MRLLQAISDQGILFVLRRNVAAEVHGIRLVSFGRPEFIRTITQALELVRHYDPRRFGRIQRHIRWVFDHEHWGGAGCASYLPNIKACRIDFEFLPLLGDALSQAAGYAGLIVHEATHAVLEARRITTTAHNRERVERLCYSEQNRLLVRLKAHHAGLCLFPAQYRPDSYGNVGKHRLRYLVTELRRVHRRDVPNPQGGAKGRQQLRSQLSSASGAAVPPADQ